MNLNCRPGDLAIRVACHATGWHVPVGALVRVIRHIGSAEFMNTGHVCNDVWHVEYRGETTGPMGFILGVPDSELRPIRDNDADDETLTWAGLPQDHKQPA